MRGFLILLALIATGCVLYFCTYHDARKIEADIRQQVISQIQDDTTSSYEFLMSDVDLIISGRDVLLQGTVPSDAMREQIEASVKKVVAVRSVNNQLTVQAQKVSENPPVIVAAPAVKAEEPKAAITEQAADQCDKEFAALLEQETIQFNSGKATVKPSSQPLLEKLAAVAKGCAGAIIEVHGYTDNTGNIMLNKALSKERAQTVADYFISKDVKAVFNVFGHGPDKPVASNKTAEGRAKNRRIEFDVRVTP